jgi:hypothetical protein
VIAPSRSAAYRRFYLYSALSVAVIAIAIAFAILLHIALQTAGFGTQPAAGDPPRNVSLAVALLAIAIPVGAAHLWLILRSLADPAERASGVRHQYLNLWVAFALLVVLFTGQSAVGAVASRDTADVTIQLSMAVVAGVVGAVAAWWISRTPPESPRPRIRSGIVVMLIAMAAAAFAVANAASGLGGLIRFVPPPQFSIASGLRSVSEQQLRSGLLSAGLALAVWALGFAWQRRWPESRDRLGYALLGYGTGTLALLVGGAFGIAGGVRYAGAPTQVSAFTTAWPSIGAGAMLVATHATLLLIDRARNGHPAVTTTRLLLAFPALVGLGMIVGGLGLAWYGIVERDAVPAQRFADDITNALALAGIGAVAYLASWLAFDRRTTAESSVRRFYLFTVVCLALISGLTSGVICLYNAITTVIGVGASPGAADSGRAALTWIVPTVALAAIFVTHLRLLLRDQRATRVADAGIAADPLVALLEDVRAARVSVEHAAKTIREGVD